MKKLIEDNASILASSSAGASAAAIWGALKNSASDKKDKLNKDKLLELVRSKIDEAKDKAKEKGGDASEGWKGMLQWVQSAVPDDAKDKVRFTIFMLRHDISR